jgi:hypothetical protein
MLSGIRRTVTRSICKRSNASTLRLFSTPVREDRQLFDLLNKLNEDANRPQTGISLRELVAFGKDPTPAKMLMASQFMYKELRIRLARYFISTLLIQLSDKCA